MAKSTRTASKKKSATAGSKARSSTASNAGSETRTETRSGKTESQTPTIREARQLCTAAELSLVTRSRDRASMSAADLGKAVGRARKLRDKYRDLAASQRRTGRGKGKGASSSATTADGNARTFRKAEIFADVLERFEAKLAQASTDKGSKGVGAAKKAAREKKETRKSKNAASVKSPQASRKRVRRALKADLSAKRGAAVESGEGVPGVRGDTGASSGKKSGRKAGPRSSGKTSANSVAKSAASKTTAGTKQASARKPGSATKSGAGTNSSTAPSRGPTRYSKVSRFIESAPIATPSSALAAAGLDATLVGIVGRQNKVERRGKRVSAKMGEANKPKIHGHVSARGRRNQAKRDGRGR